MDIDRLREQKRAEIEQQGRQMAVDEIIALKQRHHTEGLIYTFECDGKRIEAAFLTATPLPDPATAYRIELLAPLTTVANGQCYIADTHGKRLGGGAIP